MLIYIAGPYQADTPHQVKLNVVKAMRVARQVYARGHTPLIPHLLYFWHEFLKCNDKYGLRAIGIRYSPLTRAQYLRIGLEYLARCDALLCYANSPGAAEELKAAQQSQKQIYFRVADIPECGGIEGKGHDDSK